MNRELMKQCLDALLTSKPHDDFPIEYAQHFAVIEALKAELAKPEPEPVATVKTINGVRFGYLEKRLPEGTPLYTKGTQNV